MAKTFNTSIDLTLNQLLNAKVHLLAADPGSPVDGQVWINTTTWTIKYRLNGATKVVTQSGAIVDSDINAGAAIALSKLATNPLARANHTGTQLAATISDFDTQVRTSRLDQMAQPTAAVPFNAQKITGLGLGTASTDAASLQNILNTRLDQLAAPTASVSLNSQKITNLLDPTAASDAATKAYVDAVQQGLDTKQSVRAISTANITLSAPQTIDGVSVIAGDRVLVAGQTTASTNGIYVVAAGAWTRATDADVSAEVTAGMYTFIEEGTVNGDTGWQLITNNPITLGTTSLVFTQFTGAASVIAGAALVKTGNTLDVQVDNSTIEVASNQLRVKDLGITAAKLATSAVDLTTTKVTGTLPIAKGGTGQTTAAAALAALGGVRKFAGSVTGDGTTTSFNVAHSFGLSSPFQDLTVQIWEVSSGAQVECDVTVVDANTVAVAFSPAPANAKVYRVVCMG